MCRGIVPSPSRSSSHLHGRGWDDPDEVLVPRSGRLAHVRPKNGMVEHLFLSPVDDSAALVQPGKSGGGLRHFGRVLIPGRPE